jgi:hypothetical protein
VYLWPGVTKFITTSKTSAPPFRVPSGDSSKTKYRGSAREIVRGRWIAPSPVAEGILGDVVCKPPASVYDFVTKGWWHWTASAPPAMATVRDRTPCTEH